MPAPLRLVLSDEERTCLSCAVKRHPKPHARERAAALLRVGDGASARAVARAGVLRPRDEHTVCEWVRRYAAGGLAAAFAIRSGRGRKPGFPPR